jgi:drug/metabolite transporter (DMT)-like permease
MGFTKDSLFTTFGDSSFSMTLKQTAADTTLCTFPGATLFIKLVLTAIFWGGTFIAARVIAQEAGPFSASFLRFAVASLVLLPFVLRAHGSFPSLEWKQILPVVLLGLSGVFAYNYFFFSGLKMISASRASLIVATNPAFIALLSAILFKERVGLSRCLGIILSVGGAAIVVSRGNPLTILQGDFGLGELNIFGCVASWVAYSLIGKSAMKDLSPLLAVTYACVIGAACLLPAALHEGITQSIGHYSLSVWLGVFYLGLFGTAVGFIWYYEGIKSIGPSRAGVFINFVPVSAILLASLVLKEAMDAALAIGAVFVVGGVYLTNRPQRISDKNKLREEIIRQLQ